MDEEAVTDVRRRLREHPSAILLVCQVGAVLFYPFLNDAPVGRTILGVVSMLVVGLALWAVRRTPALNVVAFSLGLPALVLTVLETVSARDDTVVLISSLLHAPFYFYVAVGLIRYLFHDTHVTADEFYAVGAAFTVVAWGYCYIFQAVEVVWPGSFSGLDASADPQTWFNLLFLSFTTLTNTGLSDIVPALAHARSVVMLEQFTGVMYLGLLLARIIAMASERRNR
ncbi:MAG TPA: ion channel [Marmoricola sp.]|nr:ion channel [Marmoricola sp.]